MEARMNSESQDRGLQASIDRLSADLHSMRLKMIETDAAKELKSWKRLEWMAIILGWFIFFASGLFVGSQATTAKFERQGRLPTPSTLPSGNDSPGQPAASQEPG